MTKQRRTARRRGIPEHEVQMVAMETDSPVGCDLFIIQNGIKIARRGYPDTPEACTWVPLVEGVLVHDIAEGKIEIEHFGNIGPGSGH
jgi:hypothetical protein